MEARAAWKLRIEYAIYSPSLAGVGHFLPRDKSVEAAGPFDAAAHGVCADGESWLDLGSARGTYRVWAVPLYTPQEHRGPNDELSVAGVLEPVDLKKPQKSAAPDQACSADKRAIPPSIAVGNQGVTSKQAAPTPYFRALPYAV